MRGLTAIVFVTLAALTPAAAGPASAGEQSETERLRAKLPGEADSLAERAAHAGLICVAEAVKVRDDGRADCKVISVLKGGNSLKGKTIRVRFKLVFGGLAPQKGISAIYFLESAPPDKGGLFSRSLPTYRLISDLNGLAAPTEERLDVVRLSVAGQYGHREEIEVTPMPAPDSPEGMALDADFIVRGTIQEVALPDPKSKSAACSAILTFQAERVLKGDIAPGVIHVYVPAARPEFTKLNQKPLTPRIGSAGLFFRREARGGSYRLLSPYRGCVQAEKPSEVDTSLDVAVQKEKRLREIGLIGNDGGHDSVRDTLRTWMDAWNTKTDVERCVACYSRLNPWRRKWETGPELRQELADTMAAYPATINVVCDGVEEAGDGRAFAMVRIQMISTDPTSQVDSMQVRTAAMTFIHENGQWLILDEGN